MAVSCPAAPLSRTLLHILRFGLAIPAHPLALDDNGRLDETSQRALTRYYLAAGAGGIAVGVHTTQFEIRDPKHGLLKPVLELAAETAREHAGGSERTIDLSARPDPVLIAGVCGDTRQATAEAQLAVELGYDAGLLSLAALGDAPQDRLIAHVETIADLIPVIGFYLQPAVGGRRLDYNFWRRFAEIPNVVAVKVAPFNRYMTQDVLRAVADSGRVAGTPDEIALYTGNDDHIIFDLAATWEFPNARVHFAGGLLGHWACWTRPAVAHLEACRAARETGSIDTALQALAGQVTESNAALFDVANDFAGCIAGIHHVLVSQGLMKSARCLDPNESVSNGQVALIESIRAQYPHLTDDAWVREHVDDWRR